MGVDKNMENKNEMLCSYAALMLADAEIDITADNLNTAIGAAGGSVPAYYAAIFEKVAAARSVSEMVEKAGAGGGGGGGAAAGGAAPAAEAAKEESEEEEEEMAPATNLFGGDD